MGSPNDPERDFLRDPAPSKQSVFQTPVDLDAAPPTAPPEIVAAAQLQQAEQQQRYAAWQRKHKQHLIVSILILGLSGFLFALPTSGSDVYVWGAGILGILSGAYIGHMRVDDFWARLIHTVPQVLWSIVALLAGWQQSGFIFVIVCVMWLMHFVVSTFVGLKVHFSEIKN